MYNVINIIQCQCIIYYDVLPDTYGHLLGLMFNAQYQYTLITAVLEFARYHIKTKDKHSRLGTIQVPVI